MRGLQRPPADFARRPLTVVDWQSEDLVRASRLPTGEPHFGRSGANRFDDSRTPVRFGVMYAGESLLVAIGESVLHDTVLAGGYYDVAYSEIFDRYAWRFRGLSLELADLTGPALKALGADARLTSCTPYTIPQAWSRAIHAHPQAVDGILFMSRHINTQRSIAVFARARKTLKAGYPSPLNLEADIEKICQLLRIRLR